MDCQTEQRFVILMSVTDYSVIKNHLITEELDNLDLYDFNTTMIKHVIGFLDLLSLSVLPFESTEACLWRL